MVRQKDMRKPPANNWHSCNKLDHAARGCHKTVLPHDCPLRDDRLQTELLVNNSKYIGRAGWPAARHDKDPLCKGLVTQVRDTYYTAR